PVLWCGRAPGPFRPQKPGHGRPARVGAPAEVAEDLLKPYNVIDDPSWRRRDDVRSLSEPDRLELEVWLLEQILRYAHALGERPDSPADWQRALALLDRTVVEFPFGPFDTERRRLRAQLNLPESAEALQG